MTPSMNRLTASGDASICQRMTRLFGKRAVNICCGIVNTR